MFVEGQHVNLGPNCLLVSKIFSNLLQTLLGVLYIAAFESEVLRFMFVRLGL